MSKFDELGKRMKEFYENRTKFFLQRRQYHIIRVDGKSFHTFTRGLKRPFDEDFMSDMNKTAQYLCDNIQGAKFAFVQSDEISILITDFDKLNTSLWFDGNIQKIASVSASYATAMFNYQRTLKSAFVSGFEDEEWVDFSDTKLAQFDGRVFSLPTKSEVLNYFIWRQQDTIRNSISSMAQSVFSSKKLHGKNTTDMKKMCEEKGTFWGGYTDDKKYGRLIIKEDYLKDETVRSRWAVRYAPLITKHREFYEYMFPTNN